ncbi:MAG: NAD-dependent epimerase/dehydratase family protein [Actinophytocola sp.]|uniref:NAD-dependent epimerase/dehydratase family protein n=1 Tax=Actinophytocola sp. TaxID=1872138 RepID=UPI00132C18C4|nr:NAD-dependent epimerase/dehydratase family protein [Actinophytocola sp.]MPZ83518.1 NAD-dependent epimerase/dehydratase family protein [Actinophytocola sp.]
MEKTALVIGGTGPTGPPIIQGLRERGYRPVMLHSGKHEVDEVGPDKLEHIHVDAHFAETLASGIGDRRFDVVIATYGRLRLLPEVLKGRTTRLITVGGTIYRTPLSQPATEDSPRDLDHKIYRKIVEAEQDLLAAHNAGIFNLTHLRYPNLYGPRQLAPREWSIIRRLRDGRRRLPVLDAGLTLESRCYVDNAAHAVLLTVDHPDRSAGQMYSVVDEHTPSDADRVRAMAAVLGVEVELVNFPASVGYPAWYWGIGRSLRWGQDGTPPPTEHLLIDMDKMKRELGYRDLVDFPEAIERTVNWYLANPPEPGGEEERQLSDPFDYAAEDEFLTAYDRFVEACNTVPFAGIVYRHQYDHPKAPTSAS